MICKVRADAIEATSLVTSGSSIAIGGFGQSGVPFELIDAICEAGVSDLHVIANNGGLGLENERGIARLLDENRVSRLSCSFPLNKRFYEAYFAGHVELELIPQGTLAERLRAGGAGLGGFYTPTSVGTLLGEGGFVQRYGPQGDIVTRQLPKEHRMIDGRAYVLELPLRPDFALITARAGDRYGNLRFSLGARNFNPVAAMAARIVIAQVGQLHDDLLDPDDVHLPGIFVDHVVLPGRACTSAAGDAAVST